MVNTLIKIGEWQASKMEAIERFIVKPTIKTEKTNLILNLIFDLDSNEIRLEIAKKYDAEKDPLNFMLLKIRGGNNKAIYPTVEKSKFIQLIKTFFGKLNNIEDNLHGELFLKYKELIGENIFTELLKEIFDLKTKLIEKIEEKKGDEIKLNEKKLFNEIKITRNENPIIVYASIKSKKYGYDSPKPISQIEEYKEFVEKTFLNNKEIANRNKKLCYASGKTYLDVSEINLENRYSLNKMFVTETINYASNYNTKNFGKNYQVSQEKQKELDIASSFLLKNYKVSIAGIDHVIIPQFLSKTEIDFDKILEKIQSKVDIVFKYKEFEKIETDITDEIEDDIYWLNFLSIDSDGNYFKTTDLIKDVSKPYFLKVLKTFDSVNAQFDNYLNSKYAFNFYAIYRYFPTNNKLKKNEVLMLFKDILEHRKIDTNILFKYFSKYLICQRSGQFDNKQNHRAYGNIRDAGHFDYAIKNAVFYYLAFIQVLKKLNLININNMEENNEVLKPSKEDRNDFGKRIDDFFIKMSYSESQKALFYLGRVLSQVAYAQVKSKHLTKPVLNKINYNGMDKDSIIRLHIDLSEKVRQYVNRLNLRSVEYNFSAFTNLFNPNDKTQMLNPSENVFYILSGYSFGMVSEDTNDNNDNSNIK